MTAKDLFDGRLKIGDSVVVKQTGRVWKVTNFQPKNAHGDYYVCVEQDLMFEPEELDKI